MIEIQTNETIDLIKIEEIRKWCEYKPFDFNTKLNEEKNILLEKDILTVSFIKLLYKLLKITDNDKNNRNFKIGRINFDTYEEYKSIINMIYNLFNIDKEANLKLTQKELNQCIVLAKNSTMETVDIMNNISNFYIKSYTEYLIFNDPQSGLLQELSDKEKKLNEKLRKEDYKQAIKMRRKPHKYKKMKK